MSSTITSTEANAAPTQEGSQEAQDATQTPEQVAPEGQPTQEPNGSQEAAEDQGGDSIKELPQWAQDHISSLRREAAQRRTELNEMREKFDGAKTAEEFQAAVAEYQSKVETLERETARERAVAEALRTTGLGPEWSGYFQGGTPEEILSSAKQLAQMVSARGGGDLSGGLTPGDDSSVDDVQAAIERNRRRSAF